MRFITLSRVMTVGRGPVLSCCRCVTGLSAASEGVASSRSKLCCPERGRRATYLLRQAHKPDTCSLFSKAGLFPLGFLFSYLSYVYLVIREIF